MDPTTRRAVGWTGRSLTESQRALLDRYAEWLEAEAVPAGGIGPGEVGRVWPRHIADSMVFGWELEGADECVDIGSGVGLPGIPLAIGFPEVKFTLVDRSGRRIELLERVIRVLGIGNVAVCRRDITRNPLACGRFVSRAAFEPKRLLELAGRLLRPGDLLLAGHSRGDRTVTLPQAPEGLAVSLVTVPEGVLDTVVRLLRISRV